MSTERPGNKITRIILIFMAVLSIMTAVAMVSSFYKSGKLDYDRQSFAAFAIDEFNEHQLYVTARKAKTIYQHNDSFPLAVRKTDIRQKEISDYRDRKIDDIIASCEREDIDALLIDSCSFISDNGVVSFYIAIRKYVFNDRHLDFYGSEVKTYLFDGDTGRPINPEQAIHSGYRKPASKCASGYMKAAFGKKKLNPNYRIYIVNNKSNFNKYIIDGSVFVFLFDEDTVADSSLGIVSMPVPANLMNSTLRRHIIKRYIDPEKPMVALTYDDGPGGDAEMEILDTLYENAAVATFFYVGSRISSAPENLTRAVNIGCEVGNHSWSHPQYSLLSKKGVKKQISKTNDKIKETCGVEPVVGRPPYGDFDNDTLKASSIAQILWTVDTRDWDTLSSKATFKAVKKQKHLDGKIILMHSIYEETAEATRQIIPWLKKEGYQLVTVSELIKYKTGKKPEAGKLYRKLD